MSDKLGTFARFFICKIEFAVRETQEQKSLILLLSAEAFILHQRRIVHAHCNTSYPIRLLYFSCCYWIPLAESRDNVSQYKHHL